jgi:hypothetical protein
MFRIHVPFIILLTEGLAANITRLNIMYFAVVQHQTSSITQHFSTFSTLMFNPVCNVSLHLKLG